MEVSHPCLARTLPTVPELLEVADPPARRVLARASALCRARAAGARELVARARHLTRGPWLEEPLLERVPTEALTETDLLRALMVEETGAVAALLPGGAGEPFARAVDDFKLVTEAASNQREHPVLEPGWARRWTLAEATSAHGRRVAGGVGIDALLRWLSARGLERLLELDEAQLAGARTSGELLSACWGRLAERAGSPFEEVPRAYLDRHGGLEALDRALADSPGAMLVGAEGSGRRALAEAWGWRLRAGGGPPSLAGFRPTVARFFRFEARERARWAERLGPGPRVALLDPREGDMAFDTYECRWPLTRELVEVLGARAAEPEGALRVVVVVTPAELEQLISEVPIARRFARIAVPPGELLDRVPYWMCAAMGRPQVNVYAVAQVVQWLGEDFATRAPWRLELAFNRPWHRVEPWRLETADPRGWLARALEARAAPTTRRPRDRGGLIARFFGDEDRWRALKRLDARLHADLVS